MEPLVKDVVFALTIVFVLKVEARVDNAIAAVTVAVKLSLVPSPVSKVIEVPAASTPEVAPLPKLIISPTTRAGELPPPPPVTTVATTWLSKSAVCKEAPLPGKNTPPVWVIDARPLLKVTLKNCCFTV